MAVHTLKNKSFLLLLLNNGSLISFCACEDFEAAVNLNLGQNLSILKWLVYVSQTYQDPTELPMLKRSNSVQNE